MKPIHSDQHPRAKPAIMAMVLALFTAGCVAHKPTALIIRDPYAAVNWETTGRYRANFHTHTTGSDGQMNPHEVVDHYHRLGYRILAITDHNAVTYPWTAFTELAPADGWLQREESGQIAPDALERENREPVTLGMVAIQGNELSSHHHMGSFFNPHNGTTNEVDSLATLAALDGLAMLYHPGRYKKEIGWYVDLYRRYPHLFGLEVFNQGDRYPGDRAIWDAILADLMPDRPVWGYSNDDMHRLSHLGRNYSVMLLPTLSSEMVRHGMENGWSYFVYSPVVTNRLAKPVIRSIAVDPGKARIHIQTETPCKVVWISEGREIHQGDTIDLADVPDVGAYVRAELHGEDGIVVGTQPFALFRPVRLSVTLPTAPGQALYADEQHIVVNLELRNISSEPILGKALARLAPQTLASQRIELAAMGTASIPITLPVTALNANQVLEVAVDLGASYGRSRKISTRIALDIPEPISATVDIPSLAYARLRLRNLLPGHGVPLQVEASLDGNALWSGAVTLDARATTDVHIPMPPGRAGSKGLLEIRTRWPQDIGPTHGFLSSTIDLSQVSIIPRQEPPAAGVAAPPSSPHALRTAGSIMPVARRGQWQGTDDLSAVLDWGWDGQYVWIHAVVTDDHHTNSKTGEHIWDGDAFQIAVASMDGKPSNVAFALTDHGAVSHAYQQHNPALLERTIFTITRSEDSRETHYRVRMPLDTLGIPVAPGACFGLNAVVFDDDDGKGYDYWMQMTPGLAGSWDPRQFMPVALGDQRVSP